MGDDEKFSINAKLDMMMVAFNATIEQMREVIGEVKSGFTKCREHCESTSGDLYEKTNAIKGLQDQRLGREQAKINPYWIYAGIAGASFLLGLFGKVGLH